MSATKKHVAVGVVVALGALVVVALLEHSSTPTPTDSSSTNIAMPGSMERGQSEREGASDGEGPRSEDPSTELDAGGELPADQARRVLCDPRARILCEASLGCGCVDDVEACVERASDHCVAFHDGELADEELAATCLSIYTANAHLCLPRIHCPHIVRRLELGGDCAPGLFHDAARLCAGGRGACDRDTERCVPFSRPGEACGAGCGLDAICRGGVCVRWDEEGSSCESDGDCAPLRCVRGACALQGGAGAACERTVDCLPMHRCEEGVCRRASGCSLDVDCGPRARCEGGDVVRSVCVRGRDMGEPCREDECAPGLSCGWTGECVRSPTVGEGCSSRFRCADGLTCSDRRCEPAPREGEACARRWLGPVCEDGLRCVVERAVVEGLAEERPVCRRHGAVGERCATGGSCVGHARCVRGQCVAPDVCAADAECRAGHACIDGVCRPRRRLGERGCELVGCAPGVLCIDDRCVARPAVGSPCEGPCAAGAFCESVIADGHCVADACDSMFR